MDPDAEAEQAASTILRTGFITIVFTACNSYQTETTASVSNIQFSLPDSSANIVAPPPKPKKKKTIYLTFDDGPNKGTRKVMNIVQQEAMPITMFVVGQHVFGSAEQAATYDSLLHCGMIEIDNHSYSHAGNRFEQFYTDPEQVIDDFTRCADSLSLSSNIIRTPGRNIWRTKIISSTDIKKSTAAADSLQQKGFTLIGWDLEWHFDKQHHPVKTDDEMLLQLDSVFAKGRTKTPDHLVLLAHDQVYAEPCDSTTLHAFIRKLKQNDAYNFEMISRYPGIKD